MTLTRKTPMRRTGFKRPEPKPFALADKATTLRRSAMKSRVKKPTVAEGAKYLEACRGQRCFLRVSEICVAPWLPSESVVPCHSNQSQHGKGMGIKANHAFTVPGCFACHRWIDQSGAPRELKFSVWDRAYAEWAPIRARKLGIEEQETEVA